MSKVSRFMGKSKTIEIDGEKVEVKPLKAKNLELAIQLNDPKTRSKAMKEAIKIVLTSNFEGVTDEELDNMGMDETQDLVIAIMEVNGFNKRVTKNEEAKLDGESVKANKHKEERLGK